MNRFFTSLALYGNDLDLQSISKGNLQTSSGYSGLGTCSIESNDTYNAKGIYAVYNAVYQPASNYPVFIVGSDFLSGKQFMLPVIDPLIGKWLIEVKGLGAMVRQEEMEA